MNNPIRRQTAATLAATLLGALAIMPVAAGTIYRWTDENGQRHMETSIPANQAKLGYEVLDDSNFRVLKKVGRALNEEELAAAVKAQEAEAAAKQLAESAERHDRTLLATYMSVDDMQMARNGQLRTLDSIIESTERTRDRLKVNLDDLIASAAGYERDGRSVPKRVEDNINNVRGQIDRQTQIIEENRDKQNQIAAQFSADITRFKTLKGIVDPIEPIPSSDIGPPPVSAAIQ